MARGSILSLDADRGLFAVSGVMGLKMRVDDGSSLLVLFGAGVDSSCSLGICYYLLHLRQVDGQVVCEPAVSCFERLGLRGLGVPHDAEPVVEGLELRRFTDPPVCGSAINPVFSSLQEIPYGLLARCSGVLP